jgi:hypothetical protein
MAILGEASVTATGPGLCGWKGTLVVTEDVPGVFVIFISFDLVFIMTSATPVFLLRCPTP